MKDISVILLIVIFSSAANATPSGINISGKISVRADNTALTNADVDFKIRVLSPDGCVLYTEKFLNQDLQASSGVFNLTIGNGDVTYNAWGGTYGPIGTAKSKENLLKVFSNSATPQSGLTAYLGETCAGGTYSPADGDTRRVIIEFSPTGADNPSQYLALMPGHTIRSVPYAMLADLSSDSEKLGGVPAAQYAKLSDITGPGAEVDPTVEPFAKAPVTNLTSGRCAVGTILTFDGTSLTCVPDGGAGVSLSPATDANLGGVLVPSSSNISIDASGNIDVKDLGIAKVNGLQDALDDKVNSAGMAVCGTHQVAVWNAVSDTSACNDISIEADQISDFNTAVDARVNAGAFLPLNGTGAMSGALNLSGHNLVNTGYLHLTNQNPGAAPVAGYVWYNNTSKDLKYSDGTDVKSVVSFSGVAPSAGHLLIGKSDGTFSKGHLQQGAGITITNGDGTITIAASSAAPSGNAGGDLDGTYPNPVLKNTVTGATGTKITFNDKGLVTGAASLAASDIPSLDAAKITSGQFTDARIANVSVDKITSGINKYFTYAPNNVECADEGVLKWDDTAKHWVCGTDAGAGGGVDAVSLQGRALNAASPAMGEFLQYTGASWSRFAMPQCAANRVLTFSATGVATCEFITGLTDSAIAAGAGIARSKIAAVAGSANHVLINDGAGSLSSEAQLGLTRGGTGIGTAPTTNQILIGTASNNYVLKTLTAGTGITVDTSGASITINATATTPDNAGYAADTTSNKGVVSFDTNATTSGIVVSSGRASVNAGTTGGASDANKIAKLGASGQLGVNMIPDLSWAKITSGTPTTLSGYGITDAVRNAGGIPSLQTGNTAGRPAAATAGRVYIDNQTNLIYRDTGSTWVAIGDGAGTGTVSSVGLSLPSIFSVTNSPVTTTGTLTATLANQGANTIFAGPDGTTGAPTFRSIASADLAAGIVTTAKIADGNVTGAKLETVSGLSANTYGSATQIPAVTVDVKGRVTAITTNTITGLLPTASGVSGKYLKSNGTSWSGQDVRFTDVKNAAGVAAFSGSACTAGQALSWSSLSDSFTCQAIAINAAAITDGEVALARLPSSITGGVWSVSGVDLYRNVGRVGIGTATPSSALEVAGQVTITGGSPGLGKVLTSNASGLATWETPTVAAAGATTQVQFNDAGSLAGNSKFLYKATANKLTLGTATSDYYTLETTSTMSTANMIHLTTNSTGTSSSDGLVMGLWNDSSVKFIMREAGYDMRFGTNSSDRMTISAAGNVGIGKTDPEATLDVAGAGAFNSTYEGASGYVNTASSYIIPGVDLNIRRLILTASNVTIRLPAFVAPVGKVYTLTIFLKQDATGNRLASFIGNGSDVIKWDAGTPPVISQALNTVTILQFTKVSDEGVWYGSMIWREN